MENDLEDQLRHFFLNQFHSKEATSKVKADFLGRDLVCTPYEGDYGKVAGWVITVNGSPPKGTLFVMTYGPTAYYATATTFKRVSGERQLQMIKAFYKDRLAKATGAFTLTSGSKG